MSKPGSASPGSKVSTDDELQEEEWEEEATQSDNGGSSHDANEAVDTESAKQLNQGEGAKTSQAHAPSGESSDPVPAPATTAPRFLAV